MDFSAITSGGPSGVVGFRMVSPLSRGRCDVGGSHRGRVADDDNLTEMM